MTDTAVAAPVQAVSIQASVAPRGRRLRRRHLWLIPGIAIAILANELGKQNGVGIPALIFLSVAPDLPRLLRFVGASAAASGIRLSNLLHQPLVALAALAVATAGVANAIVPVPVLVATVMWVGHIVIGWGVNDGIRPVAHAAGRP